MSETTELLSREPKSAVEMEYATCREEILRRLDSRQQMISITLTIAGAFLGIGWGSSAVALMIYPPLALLLAAGWAQNEVRLRQLRTYIHDYLEPAIPGLGWERYSRQRDLESRIGAWNLDILAIGGIFLLTQVMALALSLFRITGSGIEWVLMVADSLSILLMLWLIQMVRQRSEM